ncbi:MAG: beta-1,6-N-acetylglucosaminyltransferase [Methylococcales symbiont of Hymedesmia sp. n. MRB-2018]|nr:MAG: beta-1,6-N-acetylglucosaminyltransferase [Methylococcales symbiont of Hymedesmia sp. n. MRB-2018]
MKIAYLILAHNTPNHLQRLIKALSSDSCEFFIHLDKKYNNKEFIGIQEHNVHFTEERVPVFWADFSQIEAILILLKTALLDRIKFDRFVLISGVDYPLRSVARIEEYFQNNKKKEFIDFDSDSCKKMVLRRLTTYSLRPGDGKVINILKKILMRVGILPSKRDYKKCFLDLVPYGGSGWWVLTREAVDYIWQFIHEKPHIVNYFKNTVCPDESFFQTILGNSHFKPMITGNFTYTDWSGGGSSPANISEKHLGIFKSISSSSVDSPFGRRENIFARKFTDDSARLVSILDKQISEQ